jgi:crotonobetaine/carnitine-CoA ligase
VRAIHCSAIPGGIHRALEERWGVPWFEAFGMTETGADLRMSPEDHDETIGTGCLGRPLPHREVQVADPSGRPVPVGEPGELRLRGVGMMLGYHDDPEATRGCFDAGWFRTGDLTRMDRHGRVYYLGRLKDSIRRSGENISAAEVEEAISGHRAVRSVAVVPVPDALRGEEVRAFVAVEAGYSATSELAAELRDFCGQRLAYFKVPRFWTFRETLPLTASERVAKSTLRAEPLGPDTFEPPRGPQPMAQDAHGRA